MQSSFCPFVSALSSFRASLNSAYLVLQIREFQPCRQTRSQWGSRQRPRYDTRAFLRSVLAELVVVFFIYNRISCYEGVCQRGAQAGGGVVLLEDQLWEVQVGERAVWFPVPNAKPDQIPGERGETAPLVPPPGKKGTSPSGESNFSTFLIAPSFFLLSLRSLSLQTLLLPHLPNPSSRERPSPLLLSPLQPPPSAPLQHPSPSLPLRPRRSASPRPAGSALRAPCHRSATP